MKHTKKLSCIILSFFIVSFTFNTCFAGSWSNYAVSLLYNKDNVRGLKGDFKIPSINAQWSNTYKWNFITFEEWIPVNGSSGDWFEIGYMDGSINNSGTYYKGCFKAKMMNGVYVEAKLNNTVYTGSRYTFTIVDQYAQNLWEIYIGSTYLGSFADTVGPATGRTYEQGYETNIEPGSPYPITGSTDITNQSYRVNGTWCLWGNSGSYMNTCPYVNAVYNFNNSSTFTQQ
ncbi:MAG: hypothetical protein N2645_00190 [Clostridia bacterium]|nr:hypothetical protein [Clostridia bacterium]